MDQAKEAPVLKAYVVFGTRYGLRWPQVIIGIAFMPNLEAVRAKIQAETPKGRKVTRVVAYDDLPPLLQFYAKMDLAFEFIGRALTTLAHINKLRARWGSIPRWGKVNFILSCIAELCLFGFLAAGIYFSFVERSFYGFLILGAPAMWVVMAYAIPMIGAKPVSQKSGGRDTLEVTE